MAANDLSLLEQRGRLTYVAPDGIEVRTMEGWFMLSLSGGTVVARKVRGRNRWQFCSVSDVLDFEVAA